jgi:two-component system, chemotaxis family, protein-glutamate methylesterase/glutaminase
MRRDIVVVGASAGGVEAVSYLIENLNGLNAALFIVVHTGPGGPGLLAELLNRFGTLPAFNAENGLRIQSGRVYVAPPDHHLMLERDHMRLIRGPLENRHRPSVDALFRSAANAYRERVIGVVLTGYLDDGSAGLLAIKRNGGLAVVQDPNDALVPSMPQAAIDSVNVDHILPLAEIPALLTSSVNHMEIAMSADKQPQSNSKKEPQGETSAYTCPQCNGTLWEVHDGDLLRFACRVGHSFSADSMLEDQKDAVERALWAAMRSLEERADLTKRLAKRAEQQGHRHAVRRFQHQSEAARNNADVLRAILTNDQEPRVKERHDEEARPA